MTPRRRRALEALVERGATEGERAAARNALQAHRARVTPPRVSNVRNAHRGFAQDFLDAIIRDYAGAVYSPNRYARDYSDAPPIQDEETAHSNPRNPRTVRIEVGTHEEMRRRHRNDSGPHNFKWQGQTRSACHFNGFAVEDGRFYLLISLGSITPLPTSRSTRHD